MRRVSSVLPKWMVSKFLLREFGRLQERIWLIYYNFEVRSVPPLSFLSLLR
jgi:hypothetical protein